LFTLAGIRKLLSWTHASLALVLDHLSKLPSGAYTQEIPGFGFPDLRAQVVHVFNWESFWIHSIIGALDISGAEDTLKTEYVLPLKGIFGHAWQIVC